MQINLLRLLLNDALNEPDEKIRIGCFWCYASDYDDCISNFKIIFMNKKIQLLKTDEFTIKRFGDGFLIEDIYNDIDFFSNQEMKFIIDSWDKTQLVKPKIIYIDSPNDFV